MHMIIIPLFDCYDVTFFIWFLYFVYGKNKLTKQTNKTVTRLAKNSFKTQIKNIFLSN